MQWIPQNLWPGRQNRMHCRLSRAGWRCTNHYCSIYLLVQRFRRQPDNSLVLPNVSDPDVCVRTLSDHLVYDGLESADLARGSLFALLEHAKLLGMLPAERGDSSAIGTIWGLLGAGVGWDGSAAFSGGLRRDCMRAGGHAGLIGADGRPGRLDNW